MAQLPTDSRISERFAVSWSVPGTASVLMLTIASWWWTIETLDGEKRTPLLIGGQRWCLPTAWFASIIIIGPGNSLARGEVIDPIIGLEAVGGRVQGWYGLTDLVIVIIAGLGLGHLPRLLRDACFEPFIPSDMKTNQRLMLASSVAIIAVLIVILVNHQSVSRGSRIVLIALAGMSLIAGLTWPRRTINDVSVLWVVAAGMLASSIATSAIAPESSLRELLSLNDSDLRSRLVTALALHPVQPILLGGLFLTMWSISSRLVWRIEPEHLPFHVPAGRRYQSQAIMSITTVVVFIMMTAVIIHRLRFAESGPAILLTTVKWTLPPLLLASFGLLLPELGADARSRPEAWGWRCDMWIGIVGVMAWEPSTILLVPCLLISGMSGFAASRVIEESGIHQGYGEHIAVVIAILALILGAFSVDGTGWNLIPWILMAACLTLGTFTRLTIRPIEKAARRGAILLPAILFGLGAGWWVWFPVIPLLIYSDSLTNEEE